MATFEVFVPVQGEVIYRVEANNAQDAEDIVSTMDWSDGELNVEQDFTYNAGTHVQLIAGAEGDLDDTDPMPIPHMVEAPLAEWERELLYPWRFTTRIINGATYEMRHIREPENV